MAKQPFHLTLPETVTTPVVVASPHSGRAYDRAFLDAITLDSAQIRSSEDAYVDLLLSGVPALGIPVLAASAPRAFLDLNRDKAELDPAVVEGAPRGPSNPRVSSGLGVIPRVVSQGRAIYRGKIPLTEAKARIKTFWHPYHDKLSALLDAAHDRFGQAILIDCHSMPHEAISNQSGRKGDVEIVLGDRFGSSAGGHHVDLLEEIFVGLGFQVARNAPFAGAYITQAYGQPEQGRHAIQIEIDRALYLNEARVEKSTGFDRMQTVMTEALRQFCAGLDQRRELAAE